MAVKVTASYLEDARQLFETYKHQAERAMDQVDDADLTRALDTESNSIATIVKHLAGNMRSRWTEFLTTDGEKPNRNRDGEFVDPPKTRDGVMYEWRRGWYYLFEGLKQLRDEDLRRTVTIRGEEHSVLQAINRQLTHQAMHVGQIILLAKHFAGDRWESISIPRGQSEQYNRNAGMTHVSDTAVMVAAARAAETRRPDALCSDPFAERLAGQRGAAILEATPGTYWMKFGMGLRTKFIDDFLRQEIEAHRIDCVLCLGAGLDARPWRLELPNRFRWVEVDFREILDYKYGVLRDDAPRCDLQRISIDITDGARRRELWSVVEGRRALLLTEGFLMYLPGSAVHAIAREAAATAAIESWIADFHSPVLLKAAHGGAGASAINRLRAPDALDAAAVRQAMEEAGWRVDLERRFIRDGGPFARARIQADGIQLDPQQQPVAEDDPAGIALLHRA